MLRVAIYLFDGVTALDAVGPFESLSQAPKSRSPSSDGRLARSEPAIEHWASLSITASTMSNKPMS